MNEISVAVIAGAVCLLVIILVWTLVNVNRILKRIEVVLIQTEHDAVKTVKNISNITESAQDKMEALDTSFDALSDVGTYLKGKSVTLSEERSSKKPDWIQLGLMGLMLLKSLKK